MQRFPDPGIEPRSPALQADPLPSEPSGKPIYISKIQFVTGNLYILCINYTLAMLQIFLKSICCQSYILGGYY